MEELKDRQGQISYAWALKPDVLLQNRYVIIGTKGFGGFGITYKAWDNRLKQTVAIKEFYPSGLARRQRNGSVATDESRRKEFFSGMTRLLKEAEYAAAFYQNPNVVQIYDYFEENNTAYIVMEYLDGVSLRDYLSGQKNGKISCALATEIVTSVIDALREIHAKGMLHGDISPDNIFLCEGGMVKLVDFGAAKLADEEREVTRSVILKPGFSPPEQYQPKSVQGPWTDTYALCAAFYQMITGVKPEESTNRLADDTLAEPKELDRDIPDYLNNLIMRGMALEPEMRFRNVNELRNAILKRTRVLNVKQEISRRKKKRRAVFAAIFFLLFLGAFFSYSIYRHKRESAALQESVISVWVRLKEDQDEETLKPLYEDMCSKFLEDQPMIEINFVFIPEDRYEEELERVLGTDEMPVLFESGDVSDEILLEAQEVGGVFDYLGENQDEYLFLEEYKAEISQGKQFPLGFRIPVVFVRRNNRTDMETVNIANFEELTGTYGKGWFVDRDCYMMLLKSFGGTVSYDTDLKMDENAEQMLWVMEQNARQASSDLLLAFFEGEISYYVASIEKLAEFNSYSAGVYEMRPIAADELYGEFTDLWSISKNAGENERIAAEMLLGYLTAEGAQKTLHVSAQNAIPLNKKAYEQFVLTNSRYGILDECLPRIKFYPSEQRRLSQQSEQLSQNILGEGGSE